jgi:hypothetical protein
MSSFLTDSLDKHLRAVQGPTPIERKLQAEVTRLTEALKSKSADYTALVAQYELRARAAPPPPPDPARPRSEILSKLIALSEQRTPYDQSVTISMRVDTRLIGCNERHEREMIAREVAAYVEEELLRCRLVDPQNPLYQMYRSGARPRLTSQSDPLATGGLRWDIP